MFDISSRLLQLDIKPQLIQPWFFQMSLVLFSVKKSGLRVAQANDAANSSRKLLRYISRLQCWKCFSPTTATKFGTRTFGFERVHQHGWGHRPDCSELNTLDRQ